MGNQDNTKAPKQDGMRRQDEQQQQQGRDRDLGADKQRGDKQGGKTKMPDQDPGRH